MSLTSQIFVMFSLLLAMLSVEGEARAFFGSLLNNFEGSIGNSSSLFSTLLAEHAAHSLSSLAQLGDLASLGANLTQSFFFG